MTLIFSDKFAINPQSAESGGGGEIETNITKFGALTEKENILLNNFSNSNYAKTTIPSIGNKSWELECEITTGTSTAEQDLFGLSTRGASPFYINSNNSMRLYLSSNGTSWDLASGLDFLQVYPNTNYRLKATFDGSKYTVSQFVNGEWSVKYTVNSSTPINSDNNLWIGINARGASPASPFLGSINLSKCSLKIDGVTVWQGTTQN